MRKEQQMVADFVADRPTLAENNNNPERMAELLRQEVEEAIEVLDDPEHLARELSDVIFFVLTVANLKGIDMAAEFADKFAYTVGRYQAHLFQNGDYGQARKLVKERELLEGDEWFYEIPKPL